MITKLGIVGSINGQSDKLCQNNALYSHLCMMSLKVQLYTESKDLSSVENKKKKLQAKGKRF